MAEDNVIIDVTPDPRPDDAPENAAVGEEAKPKKKGRFTIVLVFVLLGIGAAVAGGAYYAPVIMSAVSAISGMPHQKGPMADITRLESEISELRGLLANAVAIKSNVAGDQTDPALEMRITQLEEAAAYDTGSASAPDMSGAIDALDTRLGAIEGNVSAQLDTQMSVQKNLADRMTALERQLTMQTGQLDNLSGGSLQGLEDGLLTLSVTRLRQAVNGGGAFAAERGEVEDIVAQRDKISFEAVDALRELATYENTGVTPLAGLRAEFDQITTSEVVPSAAPTVAGVDIQDPWWETLWQSLTEGIRVRKTDEVIPVADTNPYNAIQALLVEQHLEEALNEVVALDEDMRQPLASWVERANARLATDIAVDVLMTTIRQESN